MSATPGRVVEALDLEGLLPALQTLLVGARLWARRRPLDDEVVERALDQAIVSLHARYVAAIPVYRRLAARLGAREVPDAPTIASELMMTSEVFKSYDPGWLRDRDFRAMTAWLATISTREATPDLDGVADIAAWRARLRSDGVFLAFSSGTSGQPSFVPRDRATLTALRRNGEIYARLPNDDVNSERPDCLLLTPGGMGLGIQAAARGIAERAARVHHLDPASDEGGWSDAEAFLDEAVQTERPVLVFGTPPLVQELCLRMAGTVRRPLPSGSLVVTGGGWKAARSVGLDDLLATVESVLGVAGSHVVDTYGATELNCFLLRCPSGSYHVPPVVRAVVLDDLLTPLDGDDAAGRLGFLDPFALSYPGFVIPGDLGRLVRRACACGLTGQAIIGPIERAADQGARGCATGLLVDGMA